MEVLSNKQKWIEGKKNEFKPDKPQMKAGVISTDPKKRGRIYSQEDKAKLSWSNGQTSTGVFPHPVSSGNISGDDWTSSTDYSPSSKSGTFSSASGSIENEISPQALVVKNLDSEEITRDLTNGVSQSNINNEPSTLIAKENNGSTNDVPFNEIDDLNSVMPDCVDISDYVENALLTSNASILSPDDSKAVHINDSASHLSPRLTSFQSSSTLHHDNERPVATTELVSFGLKPDVVTLDYIKSAATNFKANAENKDEVDSCSSLTSSFMSSLDSDDGSSIGSDVVENLCNKIAAATAKHKLKALKSSLNENNGNYSHVPSGFPINSENTDFNATQRPINGSGVNSHPGNNISDIKCENCGGIICESHETLAKNDIGQCYCNDDEAQHHVRELDFSNSNLKEVPNEIYDHATTLRNLSLESNAITELPKEIFDCQNLCELLVGDNDIAVLPASLAGLSKLRHLDVSKNVIEDIPECMPCLKNLAILDASVNPIEKLSESFTQLMNLQELYMNDCFFDYLPASFGRMSELRVLELRDNQLQILPKSIRRLLNLSRLDLGGNVLQDWPDVISKLTSLRELWLDCNELNSVSNEIGALTQLTYLDLSRNFLESIPNQISHLLELTDLLLAENSLTCLPDSIGFLHHLTVINLEHNQIKELPDGFGKLESLEEADISHNKLATLPSSIGKLKNLRMLLADNNQLQRLPEELGYCTAMSILQLSRNRIESLPDSLGNLKNLRVLNICQNRIPFLPINLRNLSYLEALWISPNQSKPTVPVHVDVHPDKGYQILTNVLFPQEQSGLSRASQVLGSINASDDYAIDAADDDDLEEYSRRQRGTTQVVFNLDATTYSDVWEELNAQDPVEEDSILYESSKNRSKISNKDDLKSNNSIDEHHGSNLDHPNTRMVRQVAMSKYSIEIPEQHTATGLSVSFDESPMPTVHSPVKAAQAKQHVELKLSHEPDRLSESDSKITVEETEMIVVENEFENKFARDENVSWPAHLEASKQTNSLSYKNNTTTKFLGKFNEPQTQSVDITDSAGLCDNVFNAVEVKPSRIEKPKIPAKPSNLCTKECHAPIAPIVTKPLKSNAGSFDIDVVSESVQNEKLSKTTVTAKPANGENSRKGSQREHFVSRKNIEVKMEDKTKAIEGESAINQIKFIDDDVISESAISTAYAAEDKPSSVTSGESIPATDDSGLGFNDIESRDDNEFDVVASSHDAPIKISWKTSMTRPSISADSSNTNANNNDKQNIDKQQSSLITNNNNQNKSRPRKPPVPPPPVAKKNRVTANIKRFEKQLEEGATISTKIVPSIQRESSMSKSPDLPGSVSSSKPIAMAAILPSPASIGIGNEIPYKKTSPVDDSSYDRSINDAMKSLDLYTKTSDVEKRNLSFQFKHQDQNDVITEGDVKENSQDEVDSIKNKPVHVRKSKFDEALAATKHKHYREKLEKAMQLQKNPSSVTDSIRRLSRGSTSSIASIPRITSPIPQHHTFPLEYMTADHTSSVPSEQDQRASTNDTLHLKLKEKLQPSSTSLLSNPVQTRFDHTPPASMSHKKMSMQHGSHGISKDQREEKETGKISLEEQLGQLCLDGATYSPPQDERGFIPYMPDEFYKSTSTRNKRSSKDTSSSIHNAGLESGRRPMRPDDWKHQLLEYLDRKNGGNETTASKNTIGGKSPRPHEKFLQVSSPNYQHINRSVNVTASTNERSFAKPEQLNGGRLSQHHLKSKSHEIVPENTFSKFDPKPTVKVNPTAQVSSSHFPFTNPPLHKQPGRRTAGKYQRTRTPGPELMASEPKVDVAVRPKSAMDRPIASRESLDPVYDRTLDGAKQKSRSGVSVSTTALPSYEAHILRHVGTGGVNKEEHQNYVNLDYFHNRLRASMREKRPEATTNRNSSKDHVSSTKPNRITSSKPLHGHPINPTTDNPYPYNGQSILPHSLEKNYEYVADIRRNQTAYQRPLHSNKQLGNPAVFPNTKSPYPNQDYPSLSPEYHENLSNNYTGLYPTNRVVKSTVPSNRTPNERIVPASHALYHDPHHMKRPDQARNYYQPFMRPDLPSQYTEAPYQLQPPMQQDYLDNDESATSAFRPYNHQSLIRPFQSQLYKVPQSAFYPPPSHYEGTSSYGQPLHYTNDQHRYQPSMDLLDGFQRPNTKQYDRTPEDPMSHHRPIYQQDPSKQYLVGNAEHNLPFDHRLMHDTVGVGVEILKVTVKKDPNFGFHIMGGIDSGGNPFRPDDDGVFITYVAPGGAAEGLVQPGDKILLVNGSEFIGINHKRAVELLRNAGISAKLVVERMVGRPV